MARIDDTALKLILTEARTQNKWQAKPVTEAQLREIVRIMSAGPTSMNTQPARIVFVTSAEGKARLKPHLSPGNVDKTMSAPVTAIIASDFNFHDLLPRTFPPNPAAREIFAGRDELIGMTALRNGTLQGAYFMIAARAVGLDVGGMSGFNNAGVDAEFFAGTSVRSNFLCNVGHGDPAGVMGRLPRLPFDEIARIV